MLSERGLAKFNGGDAQFIMCLTKPAPVSISTYSPAIGRYLEAGPIATYQAFPAKLKKARPIFYHFNEFIQNALPVASHQFKNWLDIIDVSSLVYFRICY